MELGVRLSGKHRRSRYIRRYLGVLMTAMNCLLLREWERWKGFITTKITGIYIYINSNGPLIKICDRRHLIASLEISNGYRDYSNGKSEVLTLGLKAEYSRHRIV